MPDCSRFQQIVNDRRAVADTLHANLNQDLADCADVGTPQRVAQCRAQVRARLAAAEAALNTAEGDLQKCLATPDLLEAQGGSLFSGSTTWVPVSAPQMTFWTLKRSSSSTVSRAKGSVFNCATTRTSPLVRACCNFCAMPSPEMSQ